MIVDDIEKARESLVAFSSTLHDRSASLGEVLESRLTLSAMLIRMTVALKTWTGSAEDVRRALERYEEEEKRVEWVLSSRTEISSRYRAAMEVIT